jgi:hypothetical protein
MTKRTSRALSNQSCCDNAHLFHLCNFKLVAVTGFAHASHCGLRAGQNKGQRCLRGKNYHPPNVPSRPQVLAMVRRYLRSIRVNPLGFGVEGRRCKAPADPPRLAGLGPNRKLELETLRIGTLKGPTGV